MTVFYLVEYDQLAFVQEWRGWRFVSTEHNRFCYAADEFIEAVIRGDIVRLGEL